MISFKTDWFDLLAVQGTLLKNLLQHHNLKVSLLLVLCLLYGPTLTTVHDHWEDHALTIWTFVGRVTSLVFNTLSRFAMVAQTVKRLPAMWKTWVQSLNQEDPLEKAMAPHSSTLAWKIPWMEDPGGLQSMGSLRVGHD